MILTLYFILILVWPTKASPWATVEQEALDEVNDEEILKAVFTSMEDYWLRRLTSAHRKKRADSIVCYDELGCFEGSGAFSYLDMLPSSPEEISTKFQLYSGNSRTDTPLLEVPYSNMSMLWAWAPKAFKADAPTKIIVHGFGSSCNHVWVYEMRSALMSVENCNVFCVDWEAGALIPNYVRAVANTRLVGKQVAMLVQGLVDHGLTLDKVHLIGFSLGAHVAGFAGAELKNISRISGLDPAGPLFENQDPKARLDETDAKFVDVIHSNGENLILGGLGYGQPMGHVDFYPNGGRMQKGCTNLFVGVVSDIIWSTSDIEGRSLCNHRRAYKFFTDSVSPRCHFPAFPCESYEKFVEGKCFPCTTKQECGNMGYYADKSLARGSLYLITREEEPFCAHQYHVQVESSPSKLPTVSYGKIQIILIGDNLINETFTLTSKDDQELGVGATLSRIVVPHPALENPTSIEIIYTAYSGWISSGLRTWSIDKIKLYDSYGNSISHCKKDLILESKVPVLLKLFPGDCNIPKELDTAITEEIDPFFITESTKKAENATISTTTSTITTTSSTTEKPRVVDGFPAYVTDKDFYQIFSNDTDNAESNKVIIDAIIPKLSVQSSEKNYTMRILRRNEITEPILQPKSTGRDFKEEIDEPVLKAIAKVEIIERTTEIAESNSKKSSVKPRGIDLGNFVSVSQIDLNLTNQWSPPQEMYPPPLGWREFWDTTREPKTMAKLSVSSDDTNIKSDVVSYPMTLQSKMMLTEKTKKHRLEHKTPQRFYALSGNSFVDYPKNNDGSITVQLFPQHLAAILKQAEQYAKANFFSPFEIFTKPRNKQVRKVFEKSNANDTKRENKKDESNGNFDTLASPRNIDSDCKSFLPKIYEYIEKGLESMKCFFGFFQNQDSRSSEVEEKIGNNSVTNSTETESEKTVEKFIPLSVESS